MRQHVIFWGNRSWTPSVVHTSLFPFRILSTEEKNAQHAANCNSEGTELVVVGQKITRLSTSWFSSVKWENNSTCPGFEANRRFQVRFLSRVLRIATTLWAFRFFVCVLWINSLRAVNKMQGRITLEVTLTLEEFQALWEARQGTDLLKALDLRWTLWQSLFKWQHQVSADLKRFVFC